MGNVITKKNLKKNPALAQAFNRVQSAGDSTFEVLAKFKEMVSDDWGLGFSKRNLANSEKRVVVLMYDDPKQPPLSISCSEGLSAEVRKALETVAKEEVLGALLEMNVVENNDGIKFLTMSAGERATVAEIKKDFVPFDGLVALS